MKYVGNDLVWLTILKFNWVKQLNMYTYIVVPIMSYIFTLINQP